MSSDPATTPTAPTPAPQPATRGLIPAAAFGVFFTDAVSITARSRATGSLVEETVAIAAASVSDPATDPIQVGQAEAAWKWTIEFPASSWTAAQPPAPGATVAADTATPPRWPALYVQEAFPLGALWHLVCSSREVPA
jgi:hypothetical protein